MKTPWMILILGLCSGCGGGGGTAPAPVSAASAPVTTPTAAPSGLASASPAPSATPTHAATASPSPGPTATPTIAPLKVLRAAPLSANPVGLSFLRRPQAGGVTSSLPTLIESAGVIGEWAGNFVVWVTDASTGLDVSETGGTMTATNGVPVNNPAFQSLACPGTSSLWCAAHPLGWWFGTASTATKPVGKQTITVSFADGVSGSITDYIYDGWNLPCNSGWAYQGGVPVAQATLATSDVYADCVTGTIKFTQGAVLIGSPVQDSYGRYEAAMPSVTAAFLVNSLFVNVPMAGIAQGQIFGMQTRDGGFAKVYMTNGASPTAINAASGMSLHAKTDGSYAF